MNIFEEQNRPIYSWAERNGFTHWSIAALWIIGSFVLFQVVGIVVSLVMLIATADAPIDYQNITAELGKNLNIIFAGNSVGQILFLGLGTWWVSRLNATKEGRMSYLNLTKGNADFPFYILVVLLMVTIQPLIWFISWINVQLPIPESFMELEQMQTQVLESYLKGDHQIMWTFFHIAIVPSICEEVLYRGYVLKSFQKDWGPTAAIILSGVIFGFYHLRLTQALPLAVIGILLGYLAWASKSIFPAMVAHLINNGGSVLTLYFFPNVMFAELTPEKMPPVWLTLVSLVLSMFIGYLIYLKTRNIKEPAY